MSENVERGDNFGIDIQSVSHVTCNVLQYQKIEHKM